MILLLPFSIEKENLPQTGDYFMEGVMKDDERRYGRIGKAPLGK